MFDAVAAGDQAPWQKYFADDSMYFDEKGRAMDKAALVKDVTPLPPGYSGNIKVVNAKSNIQGDTAILSYDLNETETIFGQNMTARYHGTDTWMYRNGKWQIVAGQMFRYYEDPAPGKADVKKYADYAGDLRTGARDNPDGFGPRRQICMHNEETARRMSWFLSRPKYSFVKAWKAGGCFARDESGKVDAMIDRRNNEDVVWKKIN